MSIKYRADIDGLRTIAVMPVLLYHAGFHGFSGGFVGVDIFFVISGFLICSIILQEVNEKRFSLLDFYERRIRRIMPALCLVVAFVLAFAPVFLLPSQFENLPSQVFGTLLFVANIVLWRQSGYFESDAAEKPLLHMWSLGVEEQFYIFIPIFIIIAVRFFHNLIGLGLILITAVSLYLSVSFTESSASAAFYLLPTRAWELCAGALIAAGVIQPTKVKWLNEALAGLGFALLFASIMLIDESMPFPGSVAIAPVLGSVLVIAFATQGTVVARLLSLRPIVWIGLISYSLYLWHWPLIVYGKNAGLLDTVLGQVGVVVVAIAFAYLSWRFVEAPFRQKQKMSRRFVFGASFAAVAALLLTGAGYATLNGWSARFDSKIVAFDRARDDVSPERDRCHVSSGLYKPEQLCVLGGETANTVLWGDSHGVELSYALSKQVPLRTITYSACPPAIGYSSLNRPKCAAHNDRVLAYLLASNDITDIILVARYDFFFDRPGFREGFRTALVALQEAGKRVVVVGPMPSLGVDTPTYLARGGAETYEIAQASTITIAITDWIGALPAAALVWPEDSFCSEGLCQLATNGNALLFDDNHPSLAAARLLAPYVTAALSR